MSHKDRANCIEATMGCIIPIASDAARLRTRGRAALLAITLALGWAAYTRQQVSRREQLTRRFTDKVERIEALARYEGGAKAARARRGDSGWRVRVGDMTGACRRHVCAQWRRLDRRSRGPLSRGGRHCLF